MRPPVFIRLLWLAGALIGAARAADSRICAGCHREIWESYRRTAMARSFYRATPQNMAEDFPKNATFYHAASRSYFTMLRRGEEYYQRRYQLDSAGRQINIMEKRIDYVMGSGNHARAYLHSTANTLIEAPLGWYAEKGGYWAMNPGYDRLHHDGFRRPITYECMFCHNAYPQIPKGRGQPFARAVYSALPEGIDCQRCHGPGLRHARLAASGARREAIRSSIVNPARLSAERQMELCMACHLETTSFPLPNAIRRYERGPFSYQPGEPLSAFILNFDHAPEAARDDKFELVSAAYRLRRSACFLKSNGRMVCTTCHNPHNTPRGEAAIRHYDGVCLQCHAAALSKQIDAGRHTRAGDCASCHMPKRRTEDVVHAVVADHYIQRRKPAGDLLAERPEREDAYRGRVVLYYPRTLPHTPENDLYLAVAQVKEESNLIEGIAQLTAAIKKYRPERAEYYLDLGQALEKSGQVAKAVRVYREATRRNPQSSIVLLRLGSALRRARQYQEAAEILKRAAAAEPEAPLAWHELGLAYRGLNRNAEAVAAITKAIELDPDLAEAHNNLGILCSATGAPGRAEAEFREAIRIKPDYADAHVNLANLLSSAGRLEAAREHFEVALQLQPADAIMRYNYALLLGRTRRFDEAQRELEASVRDDPRFADAHLLLGDLLMAKGQARDAASHYREALQIQPESGRAHAGLGEALAALGDWRGAIEHLRQAANGTDPPSRARASEMLRKLGEGR
jgi:predicted CXXCH cytochrome family protein